MPLLRVTKGEIGETEEIEDFQIPIEPDMEDILPEDSDISSESEEEDVGMPGPPIGLPPPPQFVPPPAVLPSLPPAIETGATEDENTPNVGDLKSAFYKVLWEYTNEEGDADTLSLRVGDILIVLETRADGWWRGQSGDQIGVFPVAYCEPVSEEEVKAFILETSQAKKAAATSANAATGAGSRVELEREMKALQAEEATLSAQAKLLKEEVANLKDEARKLRKKTTEELHEFFDSLPAALYQIPMFSNIQHDLVRCALHIARTLDIESEHKELLPDAILNFSNFIDEGPKTLAAEPKLKPELDKVITKILALQKFLLDEHANTNVELPRNVMDLLELLALRIHAYVQGDIDMTQATTTELEQPKSPKPTPSIAIDEVALQLPTAALIESPATKKRSKSTKTSAPGSPEESAAPVTSEDGEEAALSPREKKRRKKDRAASNAPAVDEEDGQNGKEPKEKEKKKKRRDKDGMASPRKSKMVDPADVPTNPDDTPISPRIKDKKAKKKKVDEESALTEPAQE